MNVLVCSYFLYPGAAVGGIRAHLIAEGLARLGCKVTVLTAEPDSVPEARYERVVIPHKRAVTRLRKLLEVPDPFRTWASEAFSWCCETGLLRSQDAIVTSGGPFSTHLIGLWARDGGWRGAWVAEYRDLWTNSPYYGLGSVRRTIDRRLDKRVLTSADAVVAATKTMAARLEHVSSRPVCDIYSAVPREIIRQHVDESCFSTVSGCLRMAHAGYLYKGKRDVRPLLRSIAALAQDGEIHPGSLEMHFFGPSDRRLQQHARLKPLREYMYAHGVMRREEAWRALSKMDVFVVVRWQDAADAPFLPGKVYEYLALERPILVVNAVSGGEVEHLVEELSAGAVCAHETEIREAIRGWLHEKKLHPAPLGLKVDITRYSEQRLAERYYALVDSVSRAECR